MLGLIYAHNQSLCAPTPTKPSYQFVLPKYCLNNRADRINMVPRLSKVDFETDV